MGVPVPREDVSIISGGVTSRSCHASLDPGVLLQETGLVSCVPGPLSDIWVLGSNNRCAPLAFAAFSLSQPRPALQSRGQQRARSRKPEQSQVHGKSAAGQVRREFSEPLAPEAGESRQTLTGPAFPVTGTC